MTTDAKHIERVMEEVLRIAPEELFTAEERRRIEALVEGCEEPVYDLLRGALVWRDEVPDDFTPPSAAWVKLIMLQYYRSLSWRPEEMSRGAEDIRREMISASRAVWEKAHAIGLRWIGFLPSRVDSRNLSVLLEHEKKMFDGCLLIDAGGELCDVPRVDEPKRTNR
jgi:hypothetical protein